MKNQKIQFTENEESQFCELSFLNQDNLLELEKNLITRITNACDILARNKAFDLKKFLDELTQHQLILNVSFSCLIHLARFVCLAYMNKPDLKTQNIMMQAKIKISTYILNGIKEATELHIKWIQFRNDQASKTRSVKKPKTPWTAKELNISTKCFATALFCLIENNSDTKKAIFCDNNINLLMEALTYSSDISTFTRVACTLFMLRNKPSAHLKLSLNDALKGFNESNASTLSHLEPRTFASFFAGITDEQKHILDVLKECSKMGLPLIAEKSDKNSLIHIASGFALVDVLRFLCSFKDNFEIDTKNTDGNTPLHLAAREGYVTCMKILADELIKRNPPPQQPSSPDESSLTHCQNLLSPQNSDQSTPAHLAAFNGRINILMELHAKGAPFTKNIVNMYGDTIGHVATYNGHTAVIKFLVDKKLFFDIGNKAGNTPLHLSVSNGRLETTQFLVETAQSFDVTEGKRVNWEVQNHDGNAPIHLCAYYGEAEVFKYLAKKGFNLDIPNKFSDYPVHMATLNNHASIIKILDEYNVPLERRNEDNYTAEKLAQHHKYHEAEKCLIDCIQRRKKINSKQKNVLTPFLETFYAFDFFHDQHDKAKADLEREQLDAYSDIAIEATNSLLSIALKNN